MTQQSRRPLAKGPVFARHKKAGERLDRILVE